jgi:hypothetical protein
MKAQAFNVTGPGVKFDPSQINIEVDACASGYTGVAPSSNLNIDLYIGDYACRAKVLNFTSPTGEVFTIKSGETFGYLVGETTPFVSNLGSTANVVTQANLSSPIQPTDQIQFSIYQVHDSHLDLDTGKNTVRVVSATPDVTEGDGVQIIYEISKVTEVDSNALEVFYNFTGSAVPGDDFVTPSGSVTIPAGQMSATVTIDIINDTIGEALEVLTFSITDNANYFHYGTGNTLIYDEDAGIPTTNLVMHLDPSSLVNSAGSVSGWNDLSASGQSVSQGTAGSQPFYASGIINGFDAADFDGVDDYLDIATSSDINSTGPFTEKLMFFVFETGADVTRRQIIYEQGSKSEGIVIYIDGGNLYYLVYAAGMASPAYVSTSISANTTYHATLDYSSVLGRIEAYLYSANVGSATGVTSLGNHAVAGIGGSNGPNSIFHDGSTSVTNTNFDGLVAEVVYYNGTPQTGTIPSVQQFLAGKYASDPVVVDVSVSSSSVVENSGGSANFVFTKNVPQAYDLTVNFTVGGTATSGTDYQALSGTVIIPAYQLTGQVAMIPIDDLDLEVTEDVSVTVTTGANYEIGISNASINIVDDESANPQGDYIMWVSAESGVQLNGSNVSGWIDQSTYLQTVNQNTVAMQPLYNAAGISGKASIDFDGANDALDVANSGEINGSNYNAKSIGVVFETSADVTSRQVIYEQGGNSKGLAIYIDNGTLYFNVWGSDNGMFNINTTVSANTVYRLLVSFDGVAQEMNMTLNDVDMTMVPGVGPLGKHTSASAMGDVSGKVRFHDNATNGPAPFSGKIADMIHYNSVLTTLEKSSLLLYYAVTYP